MPQHGACLQVKAAAGEAALEAARADAASLSQQLLDKESRLTASQQELARFRGTQQLIAELREQLQSVQDGARREADALRQAKGSLDRELANVRRDAEQRRREGQSLFGDGSPDAGGGVPGGPPAMAGPGFKWVLVRDDERPYSTLSGADFTPASPQATADDLARSPLATSRRASATAEPATSAPDASDGGRVDVASMLSVNPPLPRLDSSGSAPAPSPLSTESQQWNQQLRQKQSEVAALLRQVGSCCFFGGAGMHACRQQCTPG